MEDDDGVIVLEEDPAYEYCPDDLLPTTARSELFFGNNEGRWGRGGGRDRSGMLTAGIVPFPMYPGSFRSISEERGALELAL